MKGNNTIILCEAEAKEALQYYFDNVLFRENISQKVHSVDMEMIDNHSKTFLIKLEGENAT